MPIAIDRAGCLTSGAKARAFFALDGASKAAPFQSRAEALCQKRVWRRTMSAGRLSEGSFVKRPSETAVCQTLRREGGGCSRIEAGCLYTPKVTCYGIS